jgi:hypothetical protein
MSSHAESSHRLPESASHDILAHHRSGPWCGRLISNHTSSPPPTWRAPGGGRQMALVLSVWAHRSTWPAYRLIPTSTLSPFPFVLAAGSMHIEIASSKGALIPIWRTCQSGAEGKGERDEGSRVSPHFEDVKVRRSFCTGL